MNHLMAQFLKRLEEDQYYGKVTLILEHGKVTRVIPEQNMKEEAVRKFINR